ncbi:DUF4031 domain-containing protein [Pandoraea sp. ISTKB]|uniref:DUF4031 domain-containing protein n=1 Tax=Pandoraea sp. ISTKB TaxID=1586708 RepID=UPI0009F5DAEF|nr:DUF4031 domain-containing protein [Pandoraea sp. ISTKB]
MTVYVDDMRAPYGRMLMCHMLADSDEELHEMASRIGVARRWHQKSDTPHSHYDICMSKRAIAVKLGAVEVTRKGVVAVIRARRAAQLAIDRDGGSTLTIPLAEIVVDVATDHP